MFGAYKQAIAAAWINLDGNCCKTIFFPEMKLKLKFIQRRVKE